MKKILLFLSMLTGLGAMAQAPVDQTRDNRIFRNWGSQARFALIIPGGLSPMFPSNVPDSLKTKALWMKNDGVAQGLYRYNGTTWVPTAADADLSNYLQLSGITNQRVYGNIGMNSGVFYNGSDFSTIYGTAWLHGSGNTIDIGAGIAHTRIDYTALDRHRFLSGSKYVDIAGNTITSNRGDTALFSNTDKFVKVTGTGSDLNMGSHGVRADGGFYANGVAAAYTAAYGSNSAQVNPYNIFVDAVGGGAAVTGFNRNAFYWSNWSNGYSQFIDPTDGSLGATSHIKLPAEDGTRTIATREYTAANYLPFTGGSITGSLYLAHDASNAMEPITKSQFDNYTTGVTWKQEVRVKTTGNITLSGTQTVDGVVLVANDRVLVASQTTAANNGVYLVKTTAWTRALDADDPAEISTAAVLVRLGTLNKNTQWTNTNATDPVIGTDAITYGQLSGAGTYTNGPSMSLVGNVFDVNYSALDGHYVQLGGSYANPAWITSLAQSKITYTGSTSQYVRGDGTFSTLSTDVQIIGDARYAQLSVSYANPTWLTSLNYTKIASVPANSVLANITGSAAAPTAVPFYDSGFLTLTTTPAYIGTTAPSGTITNTYRWTRTNNTVELSMWLIGTSAGSALTGVTIPFPADLPTPATISGTSGTSGNDRQFYGTGGMTTALSTMYASTGRVAIFYSSGWVVQALHTAAGNFIGTYLNIKYFAL
jgi:hypothetical protein